MARLVPLVVLGALLGGAAGGPAAPHPRRPGVVVRVGVRQRVRGYLAALELRSRQSEGTAIELEQSFKKPAEYARILRWYGGELRWRRVRWYCATETIRPKSWGCGIAARRRPARPASSRSDRCGSSPPPRDRSRSEARATGRTRRRPSTPAWATAPRSPRSHPRAARCVGHCRGVQRLRMPVLRTGDGRGPRAAAPEPVIIGARTGGSSWPQPVGPSVRRRRMRAKGGLCPRT